MISLNGFLFYNKCNWNVAFMTMISLELKYYGGKNDEKLRVFPSLNLLTYDFVIDGHYVIYAKNTLVGLTR